MKTVLAPAAALAIGLASGSGAVAQGRLEVRPPVHEHEHEHDEARPNRPGLRPSLPRDLHADDHDHHHGQPHQATDRMAVIRQRTDAVARELDNVQEHLVEHLQDGHADPGIRQLYRQAESANAEAIHFRQSLRPGTQPQDVAGHFRELDRYVHGLIQGLQTLNDRPLRRASSRLAYADEQLHAVVVTGAGRPGGDFFARQSHVLAGEAEQLARAAQVTIAQQDEREGGDHRGDRELIDALRDFSAKVEHFHETAENERDRAHLAQDFEAVDESWHRVVDLINRNPHGTYLARRAQRVGSLHDDLSRALGVQSERRVIRFNLGGIGIDVER